jgi:D-tyrosyl-tRNA(Tyr) deacylase
MRLLIQRVSRASVSVGGKLISEIGKGYVILVGVGHQDTGEHAKWLATKVIGLRIFEDAEGKSNLSIQDVGGEALVVSQFTLYANAEKGRRPSFIEAAPPEIAEPLVEQFVSCLREEGLPTKTGVFRAHMLVDIQNDGPVTIWLEKQ